MAELEKYHEIDPDGDIFLLVGSSACIVDDQSNIDGSMSDKADESPDVRMRVSSKHLALSSRVFKSMLQPGFLHGDKLRSQGHAILSLPDDNPAATLILMNLIHGKIRKVPLKVDVGMLSQLAILVDKYELLEITEIIQTFWFKELEQSIPQELDEALFPWIGISWVFGKEEMFKQFAKVAMWECEGPLEINTLPIPSSVLCKRKLSPRPLITED